MSLLIVGAGGFGRETREIARAAGVAVAGYLDDDPSLHGTTVGGLPVLGDIDWYVAHDDGADLVVTTGNPRAYASRETIVGRLDLPDHRYATLIHPNATIPSSVAIGHGTIVHAGCVFTADIAIGQHVVFMPQVVLTHDDRVDDYATFGAGVNIAGGVTIGRGAYVGAGALVREHLEIGAGALVGMGSVVTRSVPAGEVWFGNPARVSRSGDE